MATLEEYKAVNGGNGPSTGQSVAPELGDGGCNVITRDTGSVVGRWSSWEAASLALNQLQQLGGKYEYRLEESHQWVRGPDHTTLCPECGTRRELPASAGTNLGIEWP